MTDALSALSGSATPPGRVAAADARRATATDLEAAFLSEMLKHAGYGKARESFGGGVGEDQFGSLLRDMQARRIAESGGIGLAEAFVRAFGAQDDG